MHSDRFEPFHTKTTFAWHHLTSPPTMTTTSTYVKWHFHTDVRKLHDELLRIQRVDPSNTIYVCGHELCQKLDNNGESDLQGLGNYLLVERGGALQGLSWVAHQQSTYSQVAQPTAIEVS